ncbi:hypothetical protein JCM16303_003283 [Sporobolomyces ruberrimus]
MVAKIKRWALRPATWEGCMWDRDRYGLGAEDVALNWSKSIMRLFAPPENEGRYLLDDAFLEKIIHEVVELTAHHQELLEKHELGFCKIALYFTVEEVAKRLGIEVAPLSSGTNPDELFRQFEPVILSHGREDRKQLLDSFIHKIEDNAFTTKDPQWRKEDEVLFLVWRHDLDEWFESWLMHDDVLLKIVNELTNLYDLTAMHQKRMRDGRDMFETKKTKKGTELRKITAYFEGKAIAKRLNLPAPPPRVSIKPSLSKTLDERSRVSLRVAAIHQLDTLGPAYHGGLVLA